MRACLAFAVMKNFSGDVRDDPTIYSNFFLSLCLTSHFALTRVPSLHRVIPRDSAILQGEALNLWLCFDSGQVTEVTAKTLPCRVVRTGGSQRKLLFVLTEGRNRQIRCRQSPFATCPPKCSETCSLLLVLLLMEGGWRFVLNVWGRNRQVGLFFILRTDGSAGGEEQSIQKSRRVDAHEGDRSQHETNMKPDESSCALLSRTLPGGWSSLSVTPLWACTARGSRDSCSAMLMRVRSMRWAAMR